MAMINRFGIKQPDGTFQYHDLGAKAENVYLDQDSLVDVIKDITKQIGLKFNSAGGVVSGELTPAGGMTYSGKPGYIAFPDGGKLRTFSGTSGQLKIYLPYSWDNTLIKFKISIANQQENSSVDYFVSGYMNSTNQKWEQCSAVSIGKYNESLSNLTVRFGSNGSNCVIAIGETGTFWSNPSIAISDVVVSKLDGSDDFLKWAKGWSVLINANSDVSFTETIIKPHVAEDINAAASGATSTALTEAKTYTDKKIADLVDSAPETLDTLKEIANEITNNQSAIDAINTAIATKADKTDLANHVNNSTIHITAAERTKWNLKQDAMTIDTQLSSTSTNPVQNKVVYAGLGEKVDKIAGKMLSTNDFTTAYKNKLDSIEANANKYVQPDSGVTPGDYRKVTVDVKGIVTAGSNPILTIAEGGTGATNAATALQNFGLTATAAELNTLDGITATTTELNYVDGVTSNIQTQLDAKAGLSTATQTANGLFSAADKKKLDGITAGANLYVHPTYTARTSGLYKIVVDGLGHVSDVTAVTKDDITALGVPSTNTTYGVATQSANGLMSSTDKTKLDGIETGANKYTLPTASTTTLGGVKTTSTVTSTSGYTACPIINGIVYYKDSNTTYSAGTGISLSGTTFSVTYGTTAGTACQGNDARLSDARAPYFANGTWYAVGDDCAIGDNNVAGTFCIKGTNGTPGIALYNSGGTKYADVIHSANISSQSVNYATSAGSTTWLNQSDSLTYGASGLQYFNKSMTAANTAGENNSPTSDWYHVIRMNHANANGYYVDLAACFHSNILAYKRVASGVSYNWITLLDSSNYTSYVPTKTGSGASGTWGINVTGSSGSCTGNAATATTATSANKVWTQSHNGSWYIDSNWDGTYFQTNAKSTDGSTLPIKVGYAGTADSASYANQLQAFTGDDFTGGNHFVKAIRENGWTTHLYMCYNGGAKQADAVSVNYANSSGSCTGNAATATTLSSTLAIDKGGTGSTTAAGAHQNLLPNHFTTPAYIDCMGSSGYTGGGGYCTLAELKSTLGSMPASDVYAWAKASAKPSYAASEIATGTFPGAVVAYANTNYTTNQIRNGVLTTTDPGAGVSSSYANGSIIYVYE